MTMNFDSIINKIKIIITIIKIILTPWILIPLMFIIPMVYVYFTIILPSKIASIRNFIYSHPFLLTLLKFFKKVITYHSIFGIMFVIGIFDFHV